MINYINRFLLTIFASMEYYLLGHDTNFLTHYWILLADILYKIFVSVSEIDLQFFFVCLFSFGHGSKIQVWESVLHLLYPEPFMRDIKTTL